MNAPMTTPQAEALIARHLGMPYRSWHGKIIKLYPWAVAAVLEAANGKEPKEKAS